MWGIARITAARLTLTKGHRERGRLTLAFAALIASHFDAGQGEIDRPIQHPVRDVWVRVVATPHEPKKEAAANR
jgi:hypothetical protein